MNGSLNGRSYCEFSSSVNETKELKQAIINSINNYTEGTVQVAEENFMYTQEFQNAFLNFFPAYRNLNQTIIDYIFKGIDNGNEFLHGTMLLLIISLLAII